MNTLQSLAALIAGGCITAGSLWAEAPKLPGSKGNLTIAVTVTDQIGGFFITDAKRESDYAKGIEYGDPLNPLGHEREDANNYVSRVTVKTQNFGTKDEPNILTISETWEEQTKLHSQKFTNANFIQQLIDREFVPVSSPAGYKLVVVFPADGEGLIFLEKAATRNVPASIYYVGREGSYGSSPEDAVRIYLDDEVEAYSYKGTRTYKHKKSAGELVEDEIGTFKQSDTFSGKINASVTLFPYFWDYGTDSYVTTGTTLYYSGLASFAGKLAEKGGYEVYYPTSLNLGAGATTGYYYDVTGYEDEDTSNIVTGSAVVSGTAVIEDITPYLDALPESLEWLKEEILEGYDTSEALPAAAL